MATKMHKKHKKRTVVIDLDLVVTCDSFLCDFS